MHIYIHPYSHRPSPNFPPFLHHYHHPPPPSMDPTQNPNRAEAERALAISIKLLAARDLVGSKRFAEQALDADPKLSDDRSDQILAVADVLLASQRRVNNHLDWYALLQLPHPPPNPSPNDPNANSNHYLLKCHYRRLSLLLHPDRNRLPGADAAFKLIGEAYSVLSDPTKRSLFDAELKISENLPSGSSGGEADGSAFWTLCPSCCHVHQYARTYQNKMLRCQTCRRAFEAVELQTMPTIVPGTDMYYATWGFFPLGFGSPNGSDWKPFVSVIPNGGAGGGSGPYQNQRPQPHADGPGSGGGGGRGSGVSGGRNKKKTARKKVMGGPPKRGAYGHQANNYFGDVNDNADGGEKGEEARGININEAAKGIGEEDIDMIIDLDATDDMLGNLQNLPFLKDDGINIHLG